MALKRWKLDAIYESHLWNLKVHRSSKVWASNFYTLLTNFFHPPTFQTRTFSCLPNDLSKFQNKIFSKNCLKVCRLSLFTSPHLNFHENENKIKLQMLCLHTERFFYPGERKLVEEGWNNIDLTENGRFFEIAFIAYFNYLKSSLRLTSFVRFLCVN